MNILITGITGFVGSHLAELLVKNKKNKVYGLCRWRSSRENIKNIINDVELIEGDLCDLSSLINIMIEHDFDVIYHLAAASYVQTSFNYPALMYNVNIIGTSNLLESILHSSNNPIVHICGSSEVYGQVDEKNVPIDENCPFNPSSPYAVSKVGEETVALQYFNTYKMKIIRSRAFTHTAPRRSDVFAMSAFGKQIAAIELKMIKHVRVGNLNSIRTFCDARDMIKAYTLLVDKCKYGEVYNIGGSETMTIGEALDIMKSLSTIKKIKHIVDKKLLRPSDVTLQIPNCEKFSTITGWEPEIKFEQTCQDILDYWRYELRVNPWKLKTVEM